MRPPQAGSDDAAASWRSRFEAEHGARVEKDRKAFDAARRPAQPAAGKVVELTDPRLKAAQALKTLRDGARGKAKIQAKRDLRDAGSALLVSAAGAEVQVAGASPAGAPTPLGAAAISGTVTDSATGDPIAGVTVTPECDSLYCPPGSLPIATTDATGAYTLAGLPEFAYLIVRYADYVTGFQTKYRGVGTGAGTTTADVAMDAGGWIYGTITAADNGLPLEGACVQAYGEFAYGTGCSGADGTFRTEGIAAGDYDVYVDGVGAYLSLAGGPFVAVTAGSGSLANRSLARGTLLSGTVTDLDDGTPILGACVEAESITDYSSACSDSDGDYSLALPAGNYTVGVWADGYSSPPSSNVSLINDTVRDYVLDPGLTISGTVTGADTGQPLPGACAQVTNAAEDYFNVVCRGDGTWKATQLPAGADYLVESYGPQRYISEWYDNKLDAASADPVVLGASDVIGIDAELAVGGSISGTVNTSDAWAIVATSTGEFVGAERVRDDGTYRVVGLAPGSYRVYFDSFGDFIDEWWDDQAAVGDADPVNVSAGTETAGIDAVLAAAGAIAGTVVDSASGNPPSEACVIAYDPTFTYELAYDCVDETGSYRLRGLPSGQYLVRFLSFGYSDQWWQGAASFDDATPVTVVAPNTTTGIDAAFTLTNAISGVVTTAGGAPVSDVEVALYDEAAEQINSLYTEADGSYRFFNVPNGSYRLFVSAPWWSENPIVSEWWQDKTTFEDADPVVVAGDNPVADFAVSQGGGVSGVITSSATGDPIAGACAFVYSPSDYTSWLASDCTNAQGAYSVGGLPAGAYLVEFVANDGVHAWEWANDAPSPATADLINVSGDNPTTVDAALEVGASISGVIVDEATGDPIPFAGVGVVEQAWQWRSYGTAADAAGAFTIGGLRADEAIVEFSGPSGSLYVAEWFSDAVNSYDATPIALALGAESSVGTVELASGGAIGGTVTFSGTGEAALYGWVDVYTGSGQYVLGRSFDGSTYQTPGLAPGLYRVRISGTFPGDLTVTEWFEGAVTFEGGQDVPVVLGEVTALTHVLDPSPTPAQIIGTVVDADTSNPVSNVCVDVYGAVSYDYVGSSCTSDGSFSVAVPLGTYKVVYQDYSGNYLTEWFEDASDFGSATPIAATTGGVYSADATLTRGGRFGGTITDAATGQPLSSVCIDVVDAFDNAIQFWGGCSSSEGTFLTPAVPAGTYRLGFSTPYGRYLTEWFDDQATFGTATPLPITLGETVSGLTVGLSLGAQVTGRVTDQYGTGRDGVNVYAVNPSDPADEILVGTTATRCAPECLSGSYSGVVVPATYKIRFSTGGPEPDTWFGGGSFASAVPVAAVTAGDVYSGIDAVIPINVATAGAPYDFNGDGTSDRAVYRDGAWLVEGQSTVYLGLADDIPVPADFDGDGDTDRAVYRGGQWFIDDDGALRQEFFGLPGDVPVPADYDGDGTAEPAVWRPDTGAWYVFGSGDPTYFGLTDDVPVPADYDGDGAAEVAVWRPSNGAWFVEGLEPVYWGLLGDVPVPADYDADGVTDFAVWRPTTGGWFIEESGQETYWGLDGDVPVPGDYSGYTSVAVWRPANGGWFEPGQDPTWFGLPTDTIVNIPHAISSRTLV